MKKEFLSGLAILLIGFMSACASTPVETPLADLTIIEDAKETFPKLNSQKFGEPQIFENEEAILELSAEQRKNFLDYYRAHKNIDKPGHQRLYEYLQEFGEGFSYGNFTSNAQSTLGNATGNCMSLAVLTTALARAADIEIEYQLVNRIPVYQEYGSVVFNAQHIRSLIYEPQAAINSGINFSRGRAVIDYYPSRNSFARGYVSQGEFFAMYYRNLASEAIGQDKHNRAYWLLKKSLEIEPENAKSINALAVLHRRVGDFEKAEELYKYGIKNAIDKVSLLRNYKVLLLTQKRFVDAEKISKELDKLDDLNPFNWLHAANDAFDEEDLELAHKLYNKAIELAPYLHQGYFGLAKTEYKRGNFRAAKIALQNAKTEAFDQKSKSIYEAKLVALTQQRFN